MVKKAAKKIRQLGIECYSFHAPFLNIDISSPDNSQRQYSLDELHKAAEAAAMLDVRHFIIHPGPDSQISFTIEERMQRLRNTADVLDKVAVRCGELGVVLVLENMLPHLPFGNTSDMLWIMGAIRNLNIATCLDTGHASLSGDLYNVMFKLSGHLRVIHANDNALRADDHLPPGKGSIDWRRLLFELSETGFHGGFILELAGIMNGDMGKMLESARIARLYLRKLMKDLYISSPPTVDVSQSSA